MATVVLGVVGSAIAGSSASAATVSLLSGLGAAIGSLVDSLALMPALSKRPDQFGPRYDDIEIGSASEGAPINRLFGPRVRSAGQLIWAGPLIREESTTSVGGKGGGSNVTNYRYFNDLAVSFGRVPFEASRVVKIWRDSTVFWEDDPSVALAGSDVSVTLFEEMDYQNSTTATVVAVYLDLAAPNGGTDLSLLRSGVDAVVAGFSNGNNNGTFRVTSSQKNAGGDTQARLFGTLTAPPVTEAAGQSVTISQTIPQYSPGKAASITVYKGSDTQSPDPTIEAREGADQVPAWRGEVYAVFERLTLENGVRLPNWHALIEVEESTTVGSVIRYECEQAGLKPQEVDVSRVSSTLDGYVVRGPQAAAASIAPLLLAYDIRVQEVGGVLVFFDRETAPVTALSAEELASHVHGEDAARPVSFDSAGARKIPSVATIRYVDPDSDYQAGSQREYRTDGDPSEQINLDFPLTLTAEEARCMARRSLYQSDRNADRVSLQLPPSRINLLEGELVTFPVDDETVTAVLKQIDRADNGLIVAEAMVEDPRSLVWASCPTEPSAIAAQGSQTPPDLSLRVIDIAPFRDADATTRGIYLAVAESDPAATWQGATIFDSPDNVSFSPVATIRGPTTMGFTRSVLGTASPFVWDRTNFVDIELQHGSVASTTENEVLNGANRIVIGGEVVGFATVQLLAPMQYRLSDLLRGRRATEEFATTSGAHAIGERVVLLNQIGIEFVPISSVLAGTTRYYKAVPSGALEGNVSARGVQIFGNNIRPFPVANLLGSRNPSTNDISVKYDRRTRAIARVFGLTPPTFFEPPLFDIDLFDTSMPNVFLRTVQSPLNEIAYTAAQQTADGITPGAGVVANVYQVNPAFGRSKLRQVTIP